VIMVAVDTEHLDDERQPALQAATRELVALRSDFRLMCISVIRAAPLGEGVHEVDTASGKHLEHKTRLRYWVEPLKLAASRVSLHVVEGANAADIVLDLAQANHVDLIVLGAPRPDQHTFAWWRSVASRVTANAGCSVHVVRVGERSKQAGSS
jgi:eukaryotic-like serine/threonine-protein kinase